MCECCDFVRSRGGRPGDPELVRQYKLRQRFRIRELIDRGSWFVQGVEAGPDNTAPEWAYTVGLWSTGHPELAIFALSLPDAQTILNAVGARILAGHPVADGDVFDDLGLPLAAFGLPNPGQVLLTAYAFYRPHPARPIPALQLVYPDVHGVWPWEPDCQLWPPGRQSMPGTFVA